MKDPARVLTFQTLRKEITCTRHGLSGMILASRAHGKDKNRVEQPTDMAENKHPISTNLLGGKYTYLVLDWKKLAEDAGVGEEYLRAVLMGRRRGSVGLLRKLSTLLGGTDAARKKLYRALLLRENEIKK